MQDSPLEFNGVRVFEVPAPGPELRTGRDAVDILSAAFERRAALILIPVQRLGDDFFDLRTQIAGEIAQKFSMYGTVSPFSQTSANGLRKARGGTRLWFVESLDELKQRLFEERVRAPSQ